MVRFFSLLLASLDAANGELGDLPVSTGCYDGNNTVYNCPAACFCDPTYTLESVQDTDNLQYSDKYSQLLHLFEPPMDDTRSKRPAMVLIHGGGFISGNRNYDAMIYWCKQLAMRGYVTVSIDYRKEGLRDLEKSNLHAMYDARAAVRWLRKNAAELRVDSERIGAFGGSAGAMTVAFMTTVDGEGDGGSSGFSSDISVGVGLSGALLPDPGMADIKAGQEVPFLDFHGCDDGVVPYEEVDPKKRIKGAAVPTIEAMRSAGRLADLYSFPGKGHVPWDVLKVEPAAGSMLGFLAEHLDLANAECPTASQVLA